MDKKYQVFISSTYTDLLQERQEVLQALLELDCIPVGMELFPAADDDQWTLIKRLIDDCDYYILIIGGRYGSVSQQGISYTQMEYEYALTNGLPIISFIHKNPENIPVGKSEKDPHHKAKLEDFKKLAQQKMCKYWESPTELGSQVSRSLVKLIKDKPQTGWTKANKTASDEATREILELKNRIQELESEINRSKNITPEGIENLQQGDDQFEIEFTYEIWTHTWDLRRSNIKLTWNELYFQLSPLMVDEATESELRISINAYIFDKVHKTIFKGISKGDYHKPKINDTDFQTIKVQFRALGLIDKSEKKRSIKDSQTYWTLTKFGDNVMVKLRALKK